MILTPFVKGLWKKGLGVLKVEGLQIMGFRVEGLVCRGAVEGLSVLGVQGYGGG